MEVVLLGEKAVGRRESRSETVQAQEEKHGENYWPAAVEIASETRRKCDVVLFAIKHL